MALSVYYLSAGTSGYSSVLLRRNSRRIGSEVEEVREPDTVRGPSHVYRGRSWCQFRSDLHTRDRLPDTAPPSLLSCPVSLEGWIRSRRRGFGGLSPRSGLPPRCGWEPTSGGCANRDQLRARRDSARR